MSSERHGKNFKDDKVKNLMTFTLMCKIYLPKPNIAKMNFIFQDILLQKITPAQASQSVLELIKICPCLVHIWQLILDRQSVSDIIIFNEIKNFVGKFLEANASIAEIFSFINIIVHAAHEQITNCEFLCRLLQFQKTLRMPMKGGLVLDIGSRLFRLIPKRNEFAERPLYPIDTITEKDLYKLEFPEEIPRKHTLHPIKPDDEKDNDNDETDESKDTIGPSYELIDVPLDNGAVALIVNNYTHSFSSGSEGDDSSFSSDRETFICQLRYHMFDVFETLVKADNHLNACYSCGAIPGILRRTLLLDLYGEHWMTFYKEIRENDKSPDFIRERATNSLLKFIDCKYKTSQYVDNLMHHFPTLDFSSYAIYSEIQEPVTIEFHDIGKITNTIFTKIVSSAHLKPILWFLNKIIPLFMASSKEESISIIGTDALANSLVYYAKISTSIRKLFIEPREGENLPSGVIYEAIHMVEAKFGPLDKTTLVDHMRLFATNFLRAFDNYTEMIEIVQYRFGIRSKDFFNLMMSLTKLSAIASRIEITHIFESIKALSLIYGHIKGTNAENRIQARLPFYKYQARRSLRVPLVRIERLYGANELTIYPLY